MVLKQSNDLKKPSGGRKGSSRKTRRYELGGYPILTTIGEKDDKFIERGRGGNVKIKLSKAKFVNLAIPEKKTTVKTEIIEVVKNPANVDYDRRKIITKGTIVRTKFGLAQITSRPGQNGLLNAILIKS